MITIYFGKSASGKDYYLQRAVHLGGLKPIVTYTTRPKRKNETDGVDYRFVTDDEFRRLYDDKKIIESRSYLTNVAGKQAIWYYGSPEVNPDEDWVGVLDVSGIISLIRHYGAEKIRLIYVRTDDEVRKTRARFRGSFDETEWNRRAEDDEKKFSDTVLNDLIRNWYQMPVQVINNSGDRPTFSSIN